MAAVMAAVATTPPLTAGVDCSPSVSKTHCWVSPAVPRCAVLCCAVLMYTHCCPQCSMPPPFTLHTAAAPPPPNPGRPPNLQPRTMLLISALSPCLTIRPAAPPNPSPLAVSTRHAADSPLTASPCHWPRTCLDLPPPPAPHPHVSLLGRLPAAVPPSLSSSPMPLPPSYPLAPSPHVFR